MNALVASASASRSSPECESAVKKNPVCTVRDLALHAER